MKNAKSILLTAIAAVLLSLCLPLPAALAAPATEAYIDGVLLTAAKPYWANGSTTAVSSLPYDQWNAY